MLETFIFRGNGTNGPVSLGVDAEYWEDAIDLLREKLDSDEYAYGILEVDRKPLCVCGIHKNLEGEKIRW